MRARRAKTQNSISEAARLLDKAVFKKQNKISEKIMALSESMCFHN